MFHRDDAAVGHVLGETRLLDFSQRYHYYFMMGSP